MANEDAALWHALRAALDEKGMSVRQLAKELAGAGADISSVESQRRKVNKWLDAQHPTLPSREQAERLAVILGKPSGYFIRQRPAGSLREEVSRLRADLEEERRRREDLQEQIAALRHQIKEDNDASGPGR